MFLEIRFPNLVQTTGIHLDRPKRGWLNYLLGIPTEQGEKSFVTTEIELL